MVMAEPVRITDFPHRTSLYPAWTGPEHIASCLADQPEHMRRAVLHDNAAELDHWTSESSVRYRGPRARTPVTLPSCTASTSRKAAAWRAPTSR